MAVNVLDLKPGDTILGWQKIGFGLRKARRKDGTMYRFVPANHARFSKDDLQHFTGLIMHNDTVNHFLTIEVQDNNRFAIPTSPPIQAVIHYVSIARMRRISKVNFAPRPENPLRPTRHGIGTGFYPYRTQEEVELNWRLNR